MKKGLLVIFLALLGAGGYYAYKYFQTSSFPETIFPARTTLYLYFHDVQEAEGNLKKTILWQQIEKSPRKDSYKRQLERLTYTIESATGVDVKPLLAQFEKDLALGVYPLGGNDKMGGAFAGYVKSESDTAKFFTQKVDPSLKRRITDIQKFSLNYDGVDYFRYNSSQFPSHISPCYALFDHHLAIASSEESLKMLLDVKAKKTVSLKNTPVFQNAKKRIDYSRGLLIFLDAQSALDIIKNNLSPTRKKFWPAVLRISGINGLENLAYGITVKGEGFEEKGFLALKDQREGLLKIYFQQQPQALESTNGIPADAKVMNAGTLADFAKMWDEVNSQLNGILNQSQYDQWQKALNAMRGIFNFDVRRDLLEPLGNEYCFSYEASDKMLSNPAALKYLLVVQVRNPEKFRETLERVVSLAALRGMEQKQEDYRGKKLQAFNLSIGQLSASPAYYLENGWFFFSTDEQFLKKSIDAREDKKNIQKLTDYQKVTAGFPEKVSGLSYTNVNAYLQMYASILSRQAEDPQNRWIREYGLEQELTSLSQNLFGAASYTVIQKDGMYLQSYSSVPISFLSLPAAASALPNLMQRYNGR
jgi:hypothetical protein